MGGMGMGGNFNSPGAWTFWNWWVNCRLFPDQNITITIYYLFNPNRADANYKPVIATMGMSPCLDKVIMTLWYYLASVLIVLKVHYEC